MREGFKKDVERYSAVAKAELSGSLDGEVLEHVLRWNVEQGSLHQHTSEPTQQAIYEIQKKKQELMEELKKTLHDIDSPEKGQESEPGRLQVSDYNAERRVAQCKLKNGSRIEVSLGEILTDGEWGLAYDFDPSSVPREVRKRCAVEETKRRLRAFLDDQILASEIDSSSTDEKKRLAYKAIKSNRERGDEPAGIVAERVVRNFLKKLVYDQGLDVQVIETDAYQDVARKIDFILHRIDRYRGVRVETAEGIHDIGVQFTTIEGKGEKIDYKKRQIDRARRELGPEDKIQDIVLVQVFLDGLRSIYDQWKEKKLPGGPDKNLSANIKARIFEETLRSIYSTEELEASAKKFGLERREAEQAA
ncbi:MAG: hypothetical protein AAB495_01670 [Patescibacteria group bacterium]